MRILLPVDGSEHSRHAIRFIAERVDRGTVELLNVQHKVPEALIELLGLESVRNAYQDEGQKVFESLKDVTEPLLKNLPYLSHGFSHEDQSHNPIHSSLNAPEWKTFALCPTNYHPGL